MVLLLLFFISSYSIPFIALHSNMVLLLSLTFLLSKKSFEIFTFQYGSTLIESNCKKLLKMMLYIPIWFYSYLAISIMLFLCVKGFTFQYGSTLIERHKAKPYKIKGLYIPIWFYSYYCEYY